MKPYNNRCYFLILIALKLSYCLVSQLYDLAADAERDNSATDGWALVEPALTLTWPGVMRCSNACYNRLAVTVAREGTLPTERRAAMTNWLKRLLGQVESLNLPPGATDQQIVDALVQKYGKEGASTLICTPEDAGYRRQTGRQSEQLRSETPSRYEEIIGCS